MAEVTAQPDIQQLLMALSQMQQAVGSGGGQVVNTQPMPGAAPVANSLAPAQAPNAAVVPNFQLSMGDGGQAPDVNALLANMMGGGGGGSGNSMMNGMMGMLNDQNTVNQINNRRMNQYNSLGGIKMPGLEVGPLDGLGGGRGGGNVDLSFGSTTTGSVTSLFEQILEQQLRQWNERTTENTTENIVRGDDASRAALADTIQTLMAGGTAEDQQQRAQRQEEIARARGTASDYTKQAAFADAEAAVQATVRQAMEQSMGNLNRAVAGAGTSGGSMQALLADNATRSAAELGAQQKLGAATDYGQIQTALQGVLEMLTRPDNSQMESLLGALSLAQQGNESRTRNTVTDRTGAETTEKLTTRQSLEQSLQQQDTFNVGISSGNGSGSGGGGRLGTYRDDSASDLYRDGPNLKTADQIARDRAAAADTAERNAEHNAALTNYYRDNYGLRNGPAI